MCPTLCKPMDCGPLGSSVHGIFLGNNTRVGCHFLLHGIFLTQGSNPGLLHCRHILYHLSHHPSHVHIHSTSKWRTQNGVSAEVVLYFSGHLGIFLLLLTLHRRDLPGSHSGQGQIISLTVISNADELGKLASRPTRPLVINKATPLTNTFHTLTTDQCHVGA